MSVWVTVDKTEYGSSGDTPEVTFNDFTLTTCSDENMSGAAEKQIQNGVAIKYSFSGALCCKE